MIRTLLRQIAATIRRWLFPALPMPGEIRLKTQREIMALEVSLTIAEGDRTDVASGTGVVNTTVAGEPRQVTVQVDAAATEIGPFYGSEGTELSGEISWIDDAGNVGPSRLFSFTLSDTIPPGEVGEIGLNVLREIPDDQVPPV